jgi:hypothetical protein
VKINWADLRTWNGSQNGAFEELCCQLAEYERTPVGSRFIRKATPDAGVECYWELTDGSEWGWQAKFFTTVPLTSGQWGQIDDSVETALEKHPNLAHYTTCLPLDRSDPRIRGYKSFLDRWNERAAKWHRWARCKKSRVNFDYWGTFEIVQRLSLEEHRGRYQFWFNKEFLSDRWFGERLSEAIANAGPRYTSELNVELPIWRLFDGIGRTPAFYAGLKEAIGAVDRQHKDLCDSKYVGILPTDKFSQLTAELIPISNLRKAVDHDQFSALPLEEAAQACARCVEIVHETNQQLHQHEKTSHPNDQEGFGVIRTQLQKLRQALWAFQHRADSYEAGLANTAALLLVGEGGTGKTHLLCDVAKRRVHQNLPTVILLGEQFGDGEPWSQILNLLSSSSEDRDEFLGALDAAAQARNARALIFIDALNEGAGTRLWPKHIAGLFEVVSRYPRIGMAVSVRSSYEPLFQLRMLVERKKLIRVEHRGFAGEEYQAVKTFFSYYGLELPRTPLLVPEHQHPLFLKLLCEGLKNKRLTAVPLGLAGISAIFRFYIEALEEKLWRQFFLDPKAQTVAKSVDLLVDRLVKTGRRWIERQEAVLLLGKFQPAANFLDSLLHALVSEGLLAEDLSWSGDPPTCKSVVRFSYDRFTDHMIIRRLLELYFPGEPNTAAMETAFAPNSPLGSLLEDELTCWSNRGLEALAIQLPECAGKELVELVPAASEFRPVGEAFVASIVWRNPKCFTDATLRYINNHIIRDQQVHDQFLDALLTVATNPEHP